MLLEYACELFFINFTCKTKKNQCKTKKNQWLILLMSTLKKLYSVYAICMHIISQPL